MKEDRALHSVTSDGSALSDLLEQYRAKYGWSYQRVADEIKSSFGVSRSEQAVRFCIQGRASTAQYRHRGLRKVKRNGVEEPPTLMLVAAVLQIPEKQLPRADANDLLEQGMEPIAIRTHMGYFAQRYDGFHSLLEKIV